MEKIVVTTDFSENSKAGIRYAIQLASSRKAALTFLHIHQVLRASFWNDEEYDHYIALDRQKLMEEFPSFISGIYESIQLTPPADLHLVVHHHLEVIEGIIEYASEAGASYICISTRGAGLIRKLFGTNTSKLIQTSTLPIISVPGDYIPKPVESVLYATDMSNHEEELREVVNFARPLNASVMMLHLHYPHEQKLNEESLTTSLTSRFNYPIEVFSKERKVEDSIMDEIEEAVKESSPSILALFSHQDRSFYERILLPGNAKEYSFHGSTPLLSFPKARNEVTD